MATRKKGTRRKSASGKRSTRTAKAGSSRKTSARRRGTTSPRKRGSTGRPTSGRKQSPVARATRVARGVVEQATVAVATGVDVLKDLGENLVDRVRRDSE